MFPHKIFLLIGLSFILSCIPSFDTAHVPGDQKAFDPVGSFEKVREYAGPGSELINLAAFKVESNGTINLKAQYSIGMGYVNYAFVRPVSAAEKKEHEEKEKSFFKERENAKVGTYDPNKKFAPLAPYKLVMVTVKKNGVDETSRYYMGGMSKAISSLEKKPRIIPFPKCKLNDLWRIALEGDITANAVADIGYDESGYHFRIPAIGVDLSFDENCDLIKSKSKFGKGR
jgi:hypothetical protein